MTKSLLTEIKASMQRSGPACLIPLARDKLTKQDADDLEAALSDRTITGSAIARVLQARGIPIKQEAVQRHRNGGCACGNA